MNKVVIVLVVGAVITLVGCKNPDYVSNRRVFVREDLRIVKSTGPIGSSRVGAETVKTEPLLDALSKTETTSEAPKIAPEEVKPVPPAAPEYTVYIVQKGDFLAKISKKFNVKVETIKELNHLKNDTIRLGQKLKLPGKIDVGEQKVPEGAIKKPPKKVEQPFKPYEGPTSDYLVKSGDTLGAIAHARGITIRQLKVLNNLNSNLLRVGQKLKVPTERVIPEAKPAESQVAIVPEVANKEPEKVVEKVAPPPAAPKNEATEATSDYVVQEGDDMANVSITFGVSAAKIRELNKLSENDQLRPGQVIKLPADVQ